MMKLYWVLYSNCLPLVYIFLLYCLFLKSNTFHLILSILIVWFVFKKKPFLFTILCIIGAFVGVVLVVTNGEMSLLLQAARFIPMIILLLAALGWALYTIGGNQFSGWSVLRYSTLS